MTGEHETVDVVVVGAGDAGLMTAISAADAGASVLVLQKLPEPGGKSSLAIGSLSAAGTSIQRAHGIHDDLTTHRRDVHARIARGTIAPLGMPKLELAMEHGADIIEQLIGYGAHFSGPHPEAAGEQRRMHVIMPHARALVEILAGQARSRGVLIRGDWPVTDLVTDRSNRVVGVASPRGTVLARRHVVIATGDFSAHPVATQDGPTGAEFALRPWATGDGHRMAAKAGAELTHTDLPLRLQLRSVDWPHIEPHRSLFEAGAVLVDRTGCRLTDELDNPAAAIAEAGDRQVYVVFDDRVTQRIATTADDSGKVRDGWLLSNKLYIATFPGVGYAYVADVLAAGYGAFAPTVPELARKLGISPTGLTEQLVRHSATASGGEHDSSEHPTTRGRVDAAPFFGFGPLQARAVLGRAGIATDDSLRVLTAEGVPIPGLLAAGAAAGVTGFAYGHGYELAWALASGRIAGVTAAGAG